MSDTTGYCEALTLVFEQVADLAAVCERQRTLITLSVARGDDPSEAEMLLAGFEAHLGVMSARLRQLQGEP
ncbi:hypothetical protein [Methylobacterium oryzisoli]|uniref:hypothetical protein n=1 Tax=Methylobacterium oryzisoli TaxID=3385502 RepID=UPI00389285EC